MRKPQLLNHEGYPCPTEYYAELHELEEAQYRKKELYKYRPLAYVCSPFAGDIKTNVMNARRYSRFTVKQGYIPITPHLFFPQFLSDSNPDERELGLVMGMVLMAKCTEVWVFGSVISEGMKREIKKAKRTGKFVRYFNEKCEEIRK